MSVFGPLTKTVRMLKERGWKGMAQQLYSVCDRHFPDSYNASAAPSRPSSGVECHVSMLSQARLALTDASPRSRAQIESYFAERDLSELRPMSSHVTRTC